MLSKTARSAALQRLEDAGVPAELQAMERDSSMTTESSYSADSERYPDGRIPFVDKHLAYLLSHPGVDHRHYLSNLRLMLRIR